MIEVVSSVLKESSVLTKKKLISKKTCPKPRLPYFYDKNERKRINLSKARTTNFDSHQRVLKYGNHCGTNLSCYQVSTPDWVSCVSHLNQK